MNLHLSYSPTSKLLRISNDKLSVKYFINKKAKFNNGDQVTAYDVKYSFDLLVSEVAHPQYRIYWSDVRIRRSH